MIAKDNSKRDPVCGMTVAADEHAIEYMQMHFAFCSVQCKERFVANPHLYVGSPGHKALKQEGVVVLKTRRLKLDAVPDAPLATAIVNVVQEMMGIEKLEINGEYVNVTYDLLQTTEAQIESQISCAGAILGNEWSERLRRSFVNFVEEWKIDSMNVPPGSSGHHH